MTQTYNQFLDNLVPGRPPTPDQVAEICRQLGKDLCHELSRRNLWTASPKLVGVLDATWTDGALAELAHDAYVHSFVRRLRGLLNQRLAGVDVVGLTHLNLRNFLTERQKDVDPIGYYIFQRTCQAARQALASSDLTVVAPETKPKDIAKADLDNATVLGFRHDATVASTEGLDAIVPTWSQDLFPDLVTASTNSLSEVIARLARHLVELRDAGIDAFRLGELVAALKRDLRQRWEARVAGDLGDPGTEDLDEESSPTVLVRPEDLLEGEQRLAFIVRCVTRRIVALDAGSVRDGLWRIWPYVRSCTVEGLARPAWTVISREVGLSRKRLPQLYAQLGEFVRQCRECLGRPFQGRKPKNNPAREIEPQGCIALHDRRETAKKVARPGR